MEEYSTRVFCISAEKVTPELIGEISFVRTKPKYEAIPYIYGELLNSLDAKQDQRCLELEKALTTDPQKVGNCWWTSCKESVKGALALLFLQQGMSIEEAATQAKKLKKLVSAIVRLQLLHEYNKKLNEGLFEPIEDETFAEIEKKTMKAYGKNMDALSVLSRDKHPWLPHI